MSLAAQAVSLRLATSAQRRRFRDGQSLPLPVWNGIFEHRGAIGSARWEFLWCIDKTTRERTEADGTKTGLVLGGKPVSAEEIGRDLDGKDPKAVRANLDRLEKSGYIRRPLRTPYGYTIEVLRSEKRDFWKRPERTGENARSLATGDRANFSSDRAKTPERTGETTRSRSDIAVDISGDRAAVPSSSASVNCRKGTDEFPQPRYEDFKKQASWLTPCRFRFAVRRILLRAKTPPRSEAFLRKSLAVFLTPTAFSGEMENFLVDEACRLLTDESLSLGDVADELKRAAAENELPYTAMSIDRAIDNARQRAEHREALTRELRIGEFTRAGIAT